MELERRLLHEHHVQVTIDEIGKVVTAPGSDPLPVSTLGVLCARSTGTVLLSSCSSVRGEMESSFILRVYSFHLNQVSHIHNR